MSLLDISTEPVEFTLVELTLSGDMTVIRNGAAETWRYEVALHSPSSGVFWAGASSDTTATIVSGNLVLDLTETFTSPDGSSRRSVGREFFYDGNGEFQTVPEPEPLAIVLAGLGVLGLRRISLGRHAGLHHTARAAGYAVAPPFSSFQQIENCRVMRTSA